MASNGYFQGVWRQRGEPQDGHILSYCWPCVNLHLSNKPENEISHEGVLSSRGLNVSVKFINDGKFLFLLCCRCTEILNINSHYCTRWQKHLCSGAFTVIKPWCVWSYNMFYHVSSYKPVDRQTAAGQSNSAEHLRSPQGASITSTSKQTPLI